PGGGTFSGPGPNISIGSGGQVAFSSNLNPGPDGANYGIYRGDGVSLDVIARDKQAAPGGGGGTFQGISLGSPSINSSGTVAFGAFIVGTAGGVTDDYGI